MSLEEMLKDLQKEQVSKDDIEKRIFKLENNYKEVLKYIDVYAKHLQELFEQVENIDNFLSSDEEKENGINRHVHHKCDKCFGIGKKIESIMVSGSSRIYEFDANVECDCCGCEGIHHE